MSDSLFFDDSLYDGNGLLAPPAHDFAPFPEADLIGSQQAEEVNSPHHYYPQRQHQQHQEQENLQHYHDAQLPPASQHDHQHDSSPSNHYNNSNYGRFSPQQVGSSQPAMATTPNRHIQNQGPLSSPGAADYTMSGMTDVDGHGMWTSWTRVFDQPRYACLDLLDNCLDATLHADFQGKVVMTRFEPNGIVIMNNSHKPIKPLKDVLVVYGSTKGVGGNAKQDAIGENGVGLKHGCATLSDSNFVLTRNGNVYSLGVIAKVLQTKKGVCLPSAWFMIDEPDSKSPGEIEQDLHAHLSNIVVQNPKIGRCVQMDLGQGDMSIGLARLVKHCQLMWDRDWEPFDHVFQVIITSLIHSHNETAVSRRSHQGNNPALLFLDEIKKLLPKFYVNIPNKGFEFWIQGEKVKFSYWQHRLVELTKFTVHVPKEIPIMDVTHSAWDKEGYELNIYCGFEALRLEDEHLANTAQMYIYSRSSGRLIQHDDDARATLGLAASGTDYQQGLTIIIDDVTAQLPLMPTKQGIAWSEQKGGETHKRNLFAWVAGAADCYWKYHSRQFKERCNTGSFKSLMQEQLRTFCDPIRHHLHNLEKAWQNSSRGKQIRGNSLLYKSLAMEKLATADFSYFKELDWRRTVAKTTKRLQIRKTFHVGHSLVPGDATIFKFTDEHYPVQQTPVPTPRTAIWNAPPQPPQPPPQHPTFTQLQAQQRIEALAQQQRQHMQRQQLQQLQNRQVMQGLQFASQQQQLHATMPAPEAAPSAVSSGEGIAAPAPAKRRRLSTGDVGTEASRPILLLDDDPSEDDEADPAPVVRLVVARKSTGEKPPPRQEDRSHDFGVKAPDSQQLVVELKRKLMACQEELNNQRRLVAEAQQDHTNTIQKFREELHQLRQQQHEKQTARTPLGGDDLEKLQRTQDELRVVKRQKELLARELQDVKEQRDEQISGLNMEIETLKMRLEQHEDTIRRLEISSGRNENVEPDVSGSFGISPVRRSKYHGTDSI